MTVCVTLMPVIAEKAGASTLDSYSCVAIDSETTLISIPWNGAAALANQVSSASCAGRSRTDRPLISASRNFLISAAAFGLGALLAACCGPQAARASAETMPTTSARARIIELMKSSLPGLLRPPESFRDQTNRKTRAA
jgi:hypothetical protein